MSHFSSFIAECTSTQDAAIGSVRVLDVLYYELPTAREKRIEEYKRNLRDTNVKEYDRTNTKSLRLYHGNRKFNTFDEAVDFIDNLGDNDNLIEISSTYQQVITCDEETRIPRDYFPSGDEDENKRMQYIKDVYNISRVLYERLDAGNFHIRTAHKVTFAYLGYA